MQYVSVSRAFRKASVGLCLAATSVASAADWPMWRHDAAHTAITSEPMTGTLKLQWRRQLETPRPAWLDESNSMLYFDHAYEPIVVGKLMVVGSMNNDSITAYDTETGAEKWCTVTDGPVRFAPVAYQSRIYAASDDGHLYCLNAEDGSLVWRFRAVPRNDRILGNGRLISRWPVRGAPVIFDGVLYFAASLWAFEGTFIYALDPLTGEEIWCNSGSGTDWNKQQHSTPAFAGVCPQGYLAATPEQLIVPSGRAVPGVYDRKTGALRYWYGDSRKLGKQAGGYDTRVVGRHFVNHGALYALKSGDGLLRVPPGVHVDEIVHYTEKNEYRRFSWVTRKDEVTQDLGVAVGPVHAMAGELLLCGSAEGLVTLLDVADAARATIAFQARVDAPVATMLAADRKLFVVTREGGIVCFGDTERASVEDVRVVSPLISRPGPAAEAIAHLLARKSSQGGYALVLGAGCEGAIDELLAQSDMHVIVVDADQGRIDALRNQLRRRGLYGYRLAAFAADPVDAGLPPYLAEIVVVAGGPQGLTTASLKALYTRLRPYGGVALVVEGGDEAAALAEQAQLVKASVERHGRSVLITRQGALPGAGTWTHQYGDAGNSVMSRDDLVKPPFGLLWFGGPPNDMILPRHGHGPAPQVVGGRLVIEGENQLRCIDVYTGRLLWERHIKDVGAYYNRTSHHPGANEIGSNYVSMPDALYVKLPDECLKLDPATGTTLMRFLLPENDDGTVPHWGFINVSGDSLVAAASPLTVEVGKVKPSEAGDPLPVPAPGEALAAIPGATLNDRYAAASKQLYLLNRHTGKVLWCREAAYTFRHNALILNRDTLFCIDTITSEKLAYLKRRGLQFSGNPVLYALDVATGAVRWQTDKDVFGTWLGYSAEHDLVVQAGSRSRDRAGDEVGQGISVLSAADGRVVWQDLSRTYEGPLILYHDQYITNGSRGEGFSLLTGRALGWRWQRDYGCNTATGSEHLMLFRSSSASYFDLKRKGGTVNLGGFKSGCTSNLIPADGVLSVPDYTRTCSCGYQNQSSVGLIHSPDSEVWAVQGMPVEGRLGINLGAEGDRLALDGTYWIESPPSGSRETVTTAVVVEGGWFYQHHSLLFEKHPKAWVAASGVAGASAIRIPVEKGSYRVRLYFAEPDRKLGVGERVFDVTVAGVTCCRELDVVREAGAPRSVIIKEMQAVSVGAVLAVELSPRVGETLLCGIELLRDGGDPAERADGAGDPPEKLPLAEL